MLAQPVQPQFHEVGEWTWIGIYAFDLFLQMLQTCVSKWMEFFDQEPSNEEFEEEALVTEGVNENDFNAVNNLYLFSLNHLEIQS